MTLPSGVRLATGVVVVAVHVLRIVVVIIASRSSSTLDCKSTLTRSRDRQKANLLTCRVAPDLLTTAASCAQLSSYFL